MGYRIIETNSHHGRRIRMASTGHNGEGDHLKRERKKQVALARFQESKKPRHLGKAGT